MLSDDAMAQPSKWKELTPKAMPEQPIAAADLDPVLRETQPLWDEVRNQRLFLTGGTGFFGTWLLSSFLHVNRALALNATATVLTRDPARFAARAPHLANHPAVTLVPGDIRGFEMPRGSFDFVIHAATDVVALATPASPLDRYSAIADGTARMLEFAATHATRKFLLTSSGAVYGKQPSTLSSIPEDYPGGPDVLAPASAYGEGKRASELMCALYAQQSTIEFKIARCFAFAGPCLPLDGNFAIGNFIRDALSGDSIQIAGDGTPIRSYLYAADLAIWLWTILFKAPPMQAFNVGSEEAISIADLARLTARTLNPQLRVDIAQQPVEGSSPLRYVPSTQRAQQQLGLHPTVSLTESIRRTAAWYGFSAPTCGPRGPSARRQPVRRNPSPSSR
jgi:dTDP-glucose 4,6-dehydratase